MEPTKQSCDAGSPFASRSVWEHLVRGAIGVAALAYGFYLAGTYAWALIPAGLIALVAFRGCPMCWTFGLIETLSRGRRHE